MFQRHIPRKWRCSGLVGSGGFDLTLAMKANERGGSVQAEGGGIGVGGAPEPLSPAQGVVRGRQTVPGGQGNERPQEGHGHLYSEGNQQARLALEAGSQEYPESRSEHLLVVESGCVMPIRAGIGAGTRVTSRDLRRRTEKGWAPPGFSETNRV